MKKSFFARITAAVVAAFTASVILSFSIVTASAADTVELSVTPAGSKSLSLEEAERNSAPDYPVLSNRDEICIVPLAAGGAAGGGAGAGAATSADDTFKSVVTFFVIWLRRVGALVAFVGAIMFGLAIKNNDAEQKQQGLLTLIAGFVVVAVCTAVDMFDLFT